MSLLQSSHRPRPLTDRDYDHEIRLLDRTRSPTPNRARSASARPTSLPPTSPSPDHSSSSSGRRYSDGHLPKRVALRRKLKARRYAKFQDRPGDGGEESEVQLDGEPELEAADTEEERGRTKAAVTVKTRSREEPESAIDILYENQRGGFLCGIPLFSAQALGNLDPPAWTNAAQKPSATNITNAQVPDPSWQWAWKEWTVNHGDGVDEDGWEYSFAFAKHFSWHDPHSWNSFVRRRAWTRMRVKKRAGYQDEAQLTNGEYFTVRPPSRSKSRASSVDGSRKNRPSMQSSRFGGDDEVLTGDIQDTGTLMYALRCCRIDREKMEAVENFIEHGEEELEHLAAYMHDIMRMFIFQASRRLLLAHLLKIFNEAIEALEEGKGEDKEVGPHRQRKCDHLAKAVKHADEEVKKLEFWSDVKGIADSGASKGAVDEAQGWDEKKWTGLDRSGPEDVISNRELSGLDNCADGEGHGTEMPSSSGKGKGKDKELA